MSERFRWGILGTGAIAAKFAAGVEALADQEVIAVGSRTQASADRFADRFDIPRRHAGYESLAADPHVDAVYVATPHSFHHDHTLLALRHGKHVLCEKPFAINAAQAQEMVDAARSAQLFLMEAMWTRFLPIMVETRRLIAEGAIGKVQMIQADFGFRASFNLASRLFDPALGGGALLDVGVYPISLASMLLGQPDRIAAVATLGATGIDENTGVLFGFPDGEVAVLYTSMRTNTPQEAVILGDVGSIRIHSPWWVGDTLTLQRAFGEREEIRRPYLANGYSHEAIEVANCVRAGKLESDVMPLDESVRIMAIMDEIRAQIGMKYPME
ncbi:MAG: Gfo/Idh/MocA family oxidoreductase [Caldilinea sp.]|nr:Gfo/Idh/MocA family oxidoreductase [Caldilinea sp.]MDW8442147.1 Gfo/Idh/MocA family oxidoreductase [Caldilineaceae bacterium]